MKCEMEMLSQIYDKTRRLPEKLQAEVLDFVEYLLFKHKPEDSQWSEFSLAQALRGLEQDAWPEYTDDDLKEKWV